ncbi:MAG TPA: mucoidy inhibitor MuiA family protein [bacterium]|nr:mucoidy inhibitor MuiA family protein [bacterium]
MVRKIVLMLLAAGALGAAELESRIVRVTVYPGAALVEREADLNLKAGANTFTLAGLPAVLVDESVHARLISGRGLAIEEIKVERWFLSRADQGEARKVETAILDLERQIMLLEGELKSLAAKEKFLHSIQASNPAGQAAAFRPDAAAWNTTLTYLGSQLNKLYEEMTALELKRRGLKEEKEALDKQLAELQSVKPREDKSIELTLRADGGGTGRLALTYLVSEVSWWPTYEIRALPGEGRMELLYSGQVRQKSGEEWNEVELALSTAQPARGATVPELYPWELRLWEPSRAALQKAGGRAENAVMAAAYDKVEEEMAPPAPAGIESRSTSLLFAIPGKRTVASGDEPARVLISRSDYAAQMSYITIPKLSSFVYLQGKIVNEGLAPLLAGQAMIYVDGDYVGKTGIKPLAPGESADLSLGIDEGIKIKRELVKKYERSKGTLSKKQEMEYDYRIVVENFKKQAVKVKVVDQLPRPLQEEIELGDVKLSPEPGEWDKEKQQMSWPMEIKPGGKSEITLHFTVSYTRNGRVIGLD